MGRAKGDHARGRSVAIALGRGGGDREVAAKGVPLGGERRLRERTKCGDRVRKRCEPPACELPGRRRGRDGRGRDRDE